MADTRNRHSMTLVLLVRLAILATIFLAPVRVSMAQESEPAADVPSGEVTPANTDDESASEAVPSQTEGNAKSEDVEEVTAEAAALIFKQRLLKGGSLAITGMAIVFVGLIAISSFITVLPSVLDYVEQFLPESDHHHGHAPAAKPAAPVKNDEEEAIVAGIAFAIHSRNRQ